MGEEPELYHPDILAYARNPVRWQEGHDAQYVIKAYNPVCGDKYELRLDVDGIVKETSFFGYGCVVSKASTALLMELLIGKSVDEARIMIISHISSLTDHTSTDPVDARFEPFLIAQSYPGRVQCVLLGWEALLRHELFAQR